jgi:hypothetical protein
MAWFEKLPAFVRDRLPGASRQEAIRLRSEIVRLYAQGRLEKATATARQLVDWQRDHLGPDHPDYAQGLENLALLLQKQGQVDEARPLMERAVVIRRAILGADHPETLEAETWLASLATPTSDSSSSGLPGSEAAGRPTGDARGRLEQGPETTATLAPAPALEAMVSTLPPTTTAFPEPSELLAWLPRVPAPHLPGRAGSLADDLATLSQAFADLAMLAETLDSVGDRLAEVHQEMREAGTPPPDDLLPLLSLARRQFDQQCDRLLGPADQTAWPRPGNLRMLALELAWSRLAFPAAAPKPTDHVKPRVPVDPQARAVLDRVLALEPMGEAEIPGWEDCRRTAQDLLETLETGANPDAATSLAEGKHPLAALIELVEHRDDLSDDRWAELDEMIGTSFGRALAQAASRGRLHLPRSDSGD